MANFDILKKDFSQDSEDVFLDLPVPLHNLSLDDRVDCGQITITREAMEDFFNPCVDEIVEMVKYHIRSIDDHGARCKNLFLIGGFGESKFLQQELEDTLKRRDDRELRVPDTSWTAVARGAVICGIEKDSMANVVRTSASPKHYGIAIDESAHGHTDERDLDVNAVTGKAIARNQMRWLINKGDVILSNEATVKEHKFVVRFREGEESKKRGSVPLYSYSEDKHRPTRLSNAKKGECFRPSWCTSPVPSIYANDYRTSSRRNS
jgi:molecular chaperone DnaK (HSP70)